jgi:hypothetical protein
VVVSHHILVACHVKATGMFAPGAARAFLLLATLECI